MAKQDVRVDLFHDGGWQDVTSDVYVRDGITITRGRSDESSTPSPTQATLTFDNRTGKYNPANPASSLYGLVGRNTPLRVSLKKARDTFTRTVGSGWGTAESGGAWSGFTSGSGSKSVDGDEGKHTISTAGNFEISTLSGISVRDYDVHTVFRLTDTDIVGGNVEPGNVVLRFADTNNYYMIRVQIVPLNDPVQVGLRKRVGGVETEIVAPVTVSAIGNYGGESIHVRAIAYGSWIGARVWRDGDPEPLDTWHVSANDTDLTSGSPGVRSGVAGGNTDVPVDFYYDSFTVLDVRFAGEIASWEPQRAIDDGDAWTKVVAAGPTRRLGQGADPLKSALRRFIENEEPTTDMVAYWPLDEGPSARQGMPLFGNITPFVRDSSFSKHPIGFGKESPAPWLETGVAVEQNAGMEARIYGMDPSTDRYVVDYVMSQPEGSSSSLVLQGNTSGPDGVPYGAEFSISFGGTDEKVIVSFFYDSVSVGSTSSATGLPQVADGAMHHVRFEAFQSGADIAWFVYIDDTSIVSNVEAGRNLTGISHVVMRFARGATYEAGAMVWGHVAIWGSGGNVVADLGEAVDAAYGYGIHPGTTVGIELHGERAGRRVERLCSEEGLAFTFVGALDEAEPMGPQYPDPLLTILSEAGSTDLGFVTDSRPALGILNRTHGSLYNQVAKLALDFAADHVAPPLDPIIDDQATRNDITVTRRDGASRRETLDTGRLSTQAPPDGVGRYPGGSETVNVAADGLLIDQGGWRLHLGTAEDIRFPQLTVDLDAVPSLADDVSAVDLGDRITIDNLPDSITPDLVSLIAQGYTETIGSHRRLITFNCTPEPPWVVGVYGDGTEGPDEPTRYSPTDSVTSFAFVAGTNTALDVADDTGGLDLWSTTADLPFDIRVAGVRLRVTAVGADIEFDGTQILTVQQTPINGIVKTIPAGSKVELWQPAVYALGGL